MHHSDKYCGGVRKLLTRAFLYFDNRPDKTAASMFCRSKKTPLDAR